MADHKHIDDVTGTATTGHVWDGDIQELDKPLPRWWLQVFYVCIIWSFGFWIFYPAWPLVQSYTAGALGHTERKAVTAEIATARKAQQATRNAIAATPLADISKNKELLAFSVAGGGALFGDNCSGCHGRGAQGYKGYPNLNDDDWLWGGKVEQIHETISYGIRNEHPKSRASAMPRFGLDGILKPAEIADTTEYVLSLTGKQTDATAAGRGAPIFAAQCAACHGEKGAGNQELGAPNLTDAIWLYGRNPADIMESIATGRGGAMPAWAGRLAPEEVKMLAVYVHALGGGK
jgi:cytochrome c oxidase cbb3-type subunit 3